jgi:hypothetical protein
MSTVDREVKVSRGALWFGLFGGALAWTVHLMLAYVAAEFGCVGRLGERGYLGISMVAWLELALTVATTLASGAATVVAYRSHRRLRSANSLSENRRGLAHFAGRPQQKEQSSEQNVPVPLSADGSRIGSKAAEDAAVAAERYMAWTGVLTSGMFTFIIVFESIPILYYLHSC